MRSTRSFDNDRRRIAELDVRSREDRRGGNPDHDVPQSLTDRAADRSQASVAACNAHDLTRASRPNLFVPTQRAVDLDCPIQHVSDRHRILECLRRALSRVRQHRVCGVTEQCHGPAAPVWDRVAIEELVEPHVCAIRGRHGRSEPTVELIGTVPGNRLRIA